MDGFDWRGEKSLKGWKTREFCRDSAPLKVKSKINLALKGLRGVVELEVKARNGRPRLENGFLAKHKGAVIIKYYHL